MSLKPPEKSDLGKSWMKNRRDKARMIQPEYHLIASEGTETEPQYFGAIQRIINSKYRDRIQLKVEGIGDNTVNLLMKACQYVQNNGIVFKHVWIVYDTDDFPAENIDMVAQLCEEYSTQGETIYHAVWSNQCVELWYLLHFMYMDAIAIPSRCFIPRENCPARFLPVFVSWTICNTSLIRASSRPSSVVLTLRFSYAVRFS